MAGHDVHLVGSVPMASTREVMEAVAAALGPRLKRIPDGETGERNNWITWLERVFESNPALEKSQETFQSIPGKRRASATSSSQAKPSMRWPSSTSVTPTMR